MGRIILTVSGKGGAGRTTYAVALAKIYALEGYPTLLLDLNPGLRNADIYMGLENEAVFDLGDVLSGLCRLDKALVRDYSCEQLFLLCGPQNEVICEEDMENVREVYEQLRSRFEFIVIDLPAGIGKDFGYISDFVDAALVVVTQDYQALRSAETIAGRLHSCGITNTCFSVNMVRPEFWKKNGLPDISDMLRVMRIPLAGLVQYDADIHIANNSGRSAVQSRDSYIFGVFDRIAQQLK